jgi:ATP-dependent helicase/nuclease subunit A
MPDILPAWLRQCAGDAPAMPTSPPPSRLVRPRIPAGSARRGRAIHALFQHIPELSRDVRENVALRLLARRGFAPAEAREVTANVLTLIENPEFAPFFSRSLPEVPFAARFGSQQAPIHGQIDRLVITDNEVFILDFKTDRRPPETAASVSPAYILQLAAYRAGIAQVFPARTIRAAILWTEIPSLMEFRNDVLDNAFAHIKTPADAP